MGLQILSYNVDYDNILSDSSSIIYKAYAKNKIKNNPDQIICKISKKLDGTDILHENNLLKELVHHNVVKQYNLANILYNDNLYVSLLLELCDYDMYNMVMKKTFSETQCYRASEDILSGLKFIHSKFIIHRDIKVENILIKNNTYKISDFGLSIHEDENDFKRCGSLPYVSPEIWEGREYDSTVDCYAFGILLYFSYIRKFPFNSPSILYLMKKVINKKIEYDIEISDEFRLFIDTLTIKKNRLKSKDIILWENKSISYEDLSFLMEFDSQRSSLYRSSRSSSKQSTKRSPRSTSQSQSSNINCWELPDRYSSERTTATSISSENKNVIIKKKVTKVVEEDSRISDTIYISEDDLFEKKPIAPAVREGWKTPSFRKNYFRLFKKI